MAEKVGVSPSTVLRIWRDHGVQPHRTRTFKYSTDPELSAKVVDVIGLYLHPPEKAVVLCVDQKSQIQLQAARAVTADQSRGDIGGPTFRRP